MLRPSARLASVLDDLPASQTRLVWLRYGLDYGHRRSIPEIAEVLGVEVKVVRRLLADVEEQLDEASLIELEELAATTPGPPLLAPSAPASTGLSGALFGRLRRDR